MENKILKFLAAMLKLFGKYLLVIMCLLLVLAVIIFLLDRLLVASVLNVGLPSLGLGLCV